MRRSYLIVIACQAAAALAAVAALRWIAVHVDPEVLGKYTLYQSVVSAGALFLISWPNAALLRFGREEWTAHARLGSTLGARLGLFVITASVALATARLLDPWLRGFIAVPESPYVWIAAGLVVIPLGELAVYASQAVGRTTAYGYSPLIVRAGFLLGVVLIPYLGSPVDWTYLAGWFVGATAAAASFVLVTLPTRAWTGLAVTGGAIVSLVRFSWTLPFAGISAYLVNWIDSWVIREFRGVAVVGIYNWAYQITALGGLAFAPVAVVLTPRVIDARVRQDLPAVQRYAGAILPSAMLLAGLLALGMLAVGPLLRALGSAKYEASYPVLLTLLGMLPLQLVTYLVTPITNAFESLLPRVVLVSAVIAVINTAGDLLLVPAIGMSGAAIATVSAMAAGALLLVRLVRREGIAMAPTSHYVRPLLLLVPVMLTLIFRTPAAAVVAVAAFLACVLTGLGASRQVPGSASAGMGAIRLRLRTLARDLTLAQ